MEGNIKFNNFCKKINDLWKEIKFSVPILISCFLTGSFITFLPIILNFCLDRIVGYNIDINAYVADYFLVIFSITLNACICLVGFEGVFSKNIKILVLIISIFFILLSWNIYRMLISENVKSGIKKMLLSEKSNLIITVKVGIFAIVMSYLISSMVEIITEKRKRNELEEEKKRSEEFEKKLIDIKEIITQNKELNENDVNDINAILEGVTIKCQ